MHLSYCFCADIPSLTLNSRVSILIHAKELKRTTNTGRLATLALTNSDLHVRGLKNSPFEAGSILQDNYQPLLFFPSDDAVDLTPEIFNGQPVHLIVPDGNWRQASKVHTRYPEFADLKRVKISARNEATHFLRKESTPEGMATLQAIAEALGIIEGDDVRTKLLRLYELKLSRTLRARGVKIEDAD
jgi:DTW domain-containing protein YfiP